MIPTRCEKHGKNACFSRRPEATETIKNQLKMAQELEREIRKNMVL